jgi:hypothetical protein
MCVRMQLYVWAYWEEALLAVDVCAHAAICVRIRLYVWAY